jgi:DNA-binding response OmpR family regulator
MTNGILYVGSEKPGRLLDELAGRLDLPVEFAPHDDLLRRLWDAGPRLVLVDCDRDDDGRFAGIRSARSLSEVPLVALVPDEHRGSEAIHLGADSVVPKPVNVEELELKVAGVLRRTAAAGPSEVYRDPQLELDRVRHRVLVRGEEIKLTPTEFAMLSALVERPGVVREHGELIEAVWGDSFHDRAEVKLYVSYLRRKLSPAGFDPIETVRGVGYRYLPQGATDPVAN